MFSCLIVANRSMGGRKLERHLHQLLAEHGDAQFHLVVPERGVEAYEFSWAAGFGMPVGLSERIEDAMRDTGERLEQVLERLRKGGLTITGELGPAPPMAAIATALDRQPYDEIVISTLPDTFSRWLRMDLPRRVTRKFHLPVTTVVHDADDVSLVPLTTRTTYPATIVEETREVLREAAREHPIHVLLADFGSPAGRRARQALDDTGLCAMHAVKTLSESLAYLRGEGLFAGRAMPDVIVVPFEAHMAARDFLAELGADAARRNRPLLMVGADDTDEARRDADAVDAWAFVPLSDEGPENTEILEQMLVELVALQHRQPILRD
ncbi:MAG: hypothetical protein Q7V88_19245 [Actinomycetota bacterium]|nr:hypothetical protein [Actinomycetota bacterium]